MNFRKSKSTNRSIPLTVATLQFKSGGWTEFLKLNPMGEDILTGVCIDFHTSFWLMTTNHLWFPYNGFLTKEYALVHEINSFWTISVHFGVVVTSNSSSGNIWIQLIVFSKWDLLVVQHCDVWKKYAQLSPATIANDEFTFQFNSFDELSYRRDANNFTILEKLRTNFSRENIFQREIL